MALGIELDVVARCLLWECAALGVLLLICNRWLILWADGAVKSAILVAVGFAGTFGAGWAALAATPILHRLPALVLLGFSLGEVRRLWLRHTYRMPAVAGSRAPRVNLTRPITTTDLVLVHYQVPTGFTSPRIRIVHLTDFHFNPKLNVSYFDRVHELVRQQAPDVILLGGDFISKIDNVSLLTAWLKNLPKAPLGTFAVLGNHDYWCKGHEIVRAELAEHGIQCIAGMSQVLTQAGDRRFVLCGTEEPWGKSARALEFDPGDYVIMLSHSPDTVYATSKRVDLMFAGHNHAGQLRLPWLGPLIVPSRYGRRLDRGAFRIDRTQLFVSAGIGVDIPYVRLYCPPEIVVVDLG